MPIHIDYLKTDKTVLTVDYGAKTKAKYNFNFDELTYEQIVVLSRIQQFVSYKLNAEALRHIKDEQVFSLIERLTRSVGGEFTYSKKYGIKKETVRAAIHEILLLEYNRITKR